MNSWFPEGLESFILPGDSDKTFVWWHRNECLCWTTVGIMRGVMSTPQTCGTFPVGPGGRWRRRCEARVGPDNAKETNAVTVSGPASLPFFCPPFVSDVSSCFRHSDLHIHEQTGLFWWDRCHWFIHVSVVVKNSHPHTVCLMSSNVFIGMFKHDPEMQRANCFASLLSSSACRHLSLWAHIFPCHLSSSLSWF